MALNVFPIQLFILRKAWKLDHINTPQSLSGSIMLNSVNIKLLKRNTPGGPVYAPGAPVYAPGAPVFAPGAPVYAPDLMMWEQAVPLEAAFPTGLMTLWCRNWPVKDFRFCRYGPEIPSNFTILHLCPCVNTSREMVEGACRQGRRRDCLAHRVSGPQTQQSLGLGNAEQFLSVRLQLWWCRQGAWPLEDGPSQCRKQLESSCWVRGKLSHCHYLFIPSTNVNYGPRVSQEHPTLDR